MSNKLILHRAKPDGTLLRDWEFQWNSGSWDREFHRDEYLISAYYITYPSHVHNIMKPNKTGVFVLCNLEGRIPWSRIHATGFTLPDGTEVTLPRGKR